MAYRMVYLRIRSGGYSFGWTSDAEQAAFKEESRRIFQELGWTLHTGSNGVCDTVTKAHPHPAGAGPCRLAGPLCAGGGAAHWGPPREPNGVGRVGKGGARKRSDSSPSGGLERCGFCDDVLPMTGHRVGRRALEDRSGGCGRPQ